MNNWIICYRKETEHRDSSKPTTIQINRNNVTAISLFDNHIEIELVDGTMKSFYIVDWDIKL